MRRRSLRRTRIASDGLVPAARVDAGCDAAAISMESRSASEAGIGRLEIDLSGRVVTDCAGLKIAAFEGVAAFHAAALDAALEPADPLRARAVGEGLRNDRAARLALQRVDRKSTRLNSSHLGISYAVFCLK